MLSVKNLAGGYGEISVLLGLSYCAYLSPYGSSYAYGSTYKDSADEWSEYFTINQEDKLELTVKKDIDVFLLCSMNAINETQSRYVTTDFYVIVNDGDIDDMLLATASSNKPKTSQSKSEIWPYSFKEGDVIEFIGSTGYGAEDIINLSANIWIIKQ